MSTPPMDIDMLSPPTSPRPASSATLTHKRSSPVPIMTKSPRPPTRFAPSIHKSSPAFTSPAAYHQPIFKPKTPRSSAAAKNYPTQFSQSHSDRSFHPPSTLHSLAAAAASAKKTTLDNTDPPEIPHNQSSFPHSNSPSPALNLNRTAPLQIPTRKDSKSSTRDTRAPARSVSNPAYQSNLLSTSPTSTPLPQSLPNLSPSFPATLFGGMSADDEHVTVWEPNTGKTVAGNAAPYRRNLAAWLGAHPGWEEKADELKSSKRRSAARRSRAAADAFAVLCCYPVATFLANEAAGYLRALGDGDHCNEEAMMTWTNDDFVRLQEALFRLGQEIHRQLSKTSEVSEKQWGQVSAQIGGGKLQGAVVYCAHHMLTRGIAKSRREIVAAGGGRRPQGAFRGMVGVGNRGEFRVGSPGSFESHDTGGLGVIDNVGPSSLPTIQVGLGASFLEKSFRAPREPRVTVWNPSNGRTISGNAAPCRRNLEAWMKQHPGWLPKEEGQLSSSRRNRGRNVKVRPSSLPTAPEVVGVASSVEPESPHFHEALQGLLCLSRSPSVGISPPNSLMAGGQLEDPSARSEVGMSGGIGLSRMESVERGGEVGEKKLGLTSSVSSSSADDGGISEGEELDSSKMEL